MPPTPPSPPTARPDGPGPLARLARQLDPRVRAALAAQLRSRRTWVFGAILVAVALILAMLPLFGALGFEFSFVMAIASSVAAADLGAALTRRLRSVAVRGTTSPPARPFHLVASLVAAAGLLALLSTLLPLALIALNSTRVRTCDWLFGLECYGALTVLSALWASGMGVLCGLIAGRRRVLSSALPYLVLVALVLHSLWRFYAAPPVFSYNPLVGYFPGNLYDEEIRLGTPLLWSRLHQIALLGGLLALAAALVDGPSAALRLHRRSPTGVRWGALLLCATALGVALILRASAGTLGFSISTDALTEELNGEATTEHFVIYYPRGGVIERDIAQIAADHEFRLAQVVRALGVSPPAERIASFYFESSDQKARFIGARNVQMAKPWRHEIYLQHAAFPHQVLRHEIAHAVAGQFGDPLFRVSAGRVLGVPVFFNAGLIEGIAVAADWPDHFTRALTPHQSVKAMTEMGMVPPLERLLSTGFFAFSSARSYTAAGSFVRFLLDRHGAARLQTLYRSGGDFELAYGRDREALFAEWRSMVASIQLAPSAHEKVRERFRRGGIFERPCPHAVAEKLFRLGWLVERGELDEAIRVARVLCEDVPDEPRHQIELAELLFRGDELDESASIYRALADDAAGTTTTIRAEALLSLARLAASVDDSAAVTANLERAAQLPVDDDQARQVAARLIASTHTGAAGPALRAYFWPADPNALGHYLVGRNLSGRGAAVESAHALRRALDLGLEHPLLVREGAERLAAEAYAAGDLESVERAAAILIADDQPDVTRLLGYDWLERVQWKRTGVLPARPLGPPTTPPAVQAAAQR
jgi:tetratricopeptide (TPR) repeat protein